MLVHCRFDALSISETNRTQILRNICDLAKEYDEAVVPVVRWLDQAERQLQKLEYVAASEERLIEQINLQKVVEMLSPRACKMELHEEIRQHREQVDEFVDTAQRLVDSLQSEDAEALSEQVTAVTRRYDALGSSSLTFARLLDEMLTGITAFFKKTEEVVDWIDKMEEAMSNERPIGIYMDVLENQIKNTMAIGEEISCHQAKVSEIVAEGRELCKHTSGDEAVALQSKLESVRLRDLSHLDEASIENQQDLIKNIEEDIVAFREVFDQFNSSGTRLRQLTSDENIAVIEATTARLNRRFEAVCEQAQRRAERLLIIRQESTDVLGDMDDLAIWFQNIEAELDKLGCVTCDPTVNQKLLDQCSAVDKEVRLHRGHAKELVASGRRLVKQLMGDDKQSVLEKIEVLRVLSNSVSELSCERLKTCEEATSLSVYFENTCKELDEWFAIMDDEFDSALEILPTTQMDQLNRQLQHNKELQRDVADAREAIDKLVKTGVSLSGLCGPEDQARISDILEQANLRFDLIKENIRLRSQTIDEAIQQSAQFSDKLDGMLNSLSVTAEQIRKVEPIAAHPDRIRTQIEDNCALMEELEHKNAAYEALKYAANDIMTKANADDPAVADIHKKMELLEMLWNEILAGTESRGMSLAETLSIAECFWEELQKCVAALSDLKTKIERSDRPTCEPDSIKDQQSELETKALKWIGEAEIKLESSPTSFSDLLELQKQIDDLVEFKEDLDKHAVKLEQLNQQAATLTDGCSPDQCLTVQRTLLDINKRWDNLSRGILERQHVLEKSLLQMGHFEEALDQLLEWMTKTENAIEEVRPFPGDLKQTEIEIAKLKVIQNDVLSHQVNIDTLNDARTKMTTANASQDVLEKLNNLNSRWDGLHQLLSSKMDLLRNCKAEAEAMIYDETEANKVKIEELLNAEHDDAEGEQVKLSSLNVKSLKQRWDGLLNKVYDRKTKLELALQEAVEFDELISHFTEWLQKAENYLNDLVPVSRLIDPLSAQMDEHQIFQNEVELEREIASDLDKKGTKLKYTCQKQDVTIIKNSLASAKTRWNKVLARSADRTKLLESSYKETSEFLTLWKVLCNWCEESIRWLNEQASASLPSNAQKIKEHLDKHKVCLKTSTFPIYLLFKFYSVSYSENAVS
ncbi:unnamed protein product [Soboliphyme baturini]|uniref:PH domain-containing protein n=1 Tax=Soboliphyme baturini TaxID=241478 RepID=A0A183IQ74_9BILA|nr:unnamed protein product [Soboliphyme baturini]